jgi:dipeptidyl-peptidase-4
VFVKDHNLWQRATLDGSESPLTTDGREGDEFTDDFSTVWSPNSASVVALRSVGGGNRQMHWVQSSPPDQIQPKLESSVYLVPGDPLPFYWPRLFNIITRKEIPIVGMDVKDPETMTAGLWSDDSSRFGVYYYQRGHQLARAITVDAATGRARTILEERSNTFINSFSAWCGFDTSNHDVYWMSERDGWNHLYRYDSATGRLINQITKGKWAVEPWDDTVDDWEPRGVFFRARGVDSRQDPYYVHFCQIQPDGTKLVDLTPGDGTHEIQDSPGSSGNRFYIDTYSRVDMPPVIELRRYSDGGLVCPLETAAPFWLLQSGWRYPERFTAKGRDGVTDIYGVIYRPTNFDPAKHYPVVEHIYTGAWKASVPKAFVRWTEEMTVAELGMIVVQIDGMGTPGRGKAFHDVCWHNMRDCGFADRIAWIKAAAAKYPEMDLSRVGIYGGSSGGYAAVRALEDQGDFYKVAVAQDGVQDPRITHHEDVERWMGWPVGPWYAEQSNADPAAVARITGKLLLVVSELDHIASPANTMHVVDALIKANKDFDFIEIPNADHGGGFSYVDRRRKDFLVRNLLGVEPRAK